MLPKYLRDKSIKAKANKREDKVYKHLVSGALDFFKGDFSTDDSVVDNKSTDKKSIRVTEDMLKKLLDDTIEVGKANGILILDLPNYYLIGKAVRK
jgi:hypothetical protein